MAGSILDKIHQVVINAFFDRVQKTEDCWLWAGAKSGTEGYGMLRVCKHPLSAHRLSWEIHNGPIPDGMVICHKCDTPDCVNPDHLFTGTQSDNIQDSVAKGRHSSVTQNPRGLLGRKDEAESQPEQIAEPDPPSFFREGGRYWCRIEQDGRSRTRALHRDESIARKQYTQLRAG